ncbi:hypothetical protein HOO54_02810 [Bacillus sp. WMMC1349]|uniref:hypothetical protein n=1 Tax=Bacillus sp. WMMC1349 TaxID=2736254 RepID=UPI001557DED5|nr:hypothetical protein [Bacillus sp. WMMC1349]NPC91211.1 hypothetical protein [Bacillus sp. WMMC1349]
MIKSRSEIHYLIKNYSWMMKLIIMKRQEMVSNSHSLTSKYGIEAALPTSKGNQSDPVYLEVLRIEKYNQKFEKMKRNLQFILKHQEVITDEKNAFIFNRLLDGLTIREISDEINISFAQVNRRKNEIVNQIYESQFKEEMTQTTQMKI